MNSVKFRKLRDRMQESRELGRDVGELIQGLMEMVRDQDVEIEILKTNLESLRMSVITGRKEMP